MPRSKDSLSFIADENIDQRIVQLLREANLQIHSVAEIAPGTSDQSVIELAVDKRSIILTDDKDFGEMVFRQFQDCPGVILLRLAGLDFRTRARLLIDTIERLGKAINGKFAVLNPKRVRIRSIR